jgi:peptidylprolyl isomerase
MKVTTLLLSLFFLGTTDALSLCDGRTVRISGTEPSVVDRRAFVHVASIGAVAATLGSSPWNAMAADDDGFVTTESGLQYKVTKEGLPDGALPSPGQTVKTQYTGWLDDFESEKKFDSSRDRNRPFSFKVGAGQVIRGWDETFLSMKVGERRQIIIPARLGYGDRGAGGIIPGGATLYFDVELLAIQ